MDPEYGRRYRELFTSHWWWRARAQLVLEVLRRHAPSGGWPAILDVGSGDGLFLDELAEFGKAEGVEPDAALVSDRMRQDGRVHVQPFDARFQPGRRYNLILFLDVLEHLRDPVAALQHATSLLAPGGTIIITVPAFRALWTAHDDWNHHVTRYTRAELAAQLAAAGLRMDEGFYFFHWLVPLKLASRALEATRAVQPGMPSVPPAPLNRLFRAISRLEARLLTPLHLPFGSSLLAVAAPVGSAGT